MMVSEFSVLYSQVLLRCLGTWQNILAWVA